MANNTNNITLKIDMDTKDVKQSLNVFKKTTEKAFKSSDVSIQSLGNSLNKVNQNLRKSLSELQKMQTTRVPTEEFRQLENDTEKAEKAFIRAKKQLDNFNENKKFQMTSEYSRLNDTLNSTKSKMKDISSTLKTMYGKKALTDEFAGASRQVDSLQRKLQNAKAELYQFTSKGVYTGEEYRNAQKKVYEYKHALTDAQEAQAKLIRDGQQFKDQAGYNRLTGELSKLKVEYDNTANSMEKLIKDGRAFEETTTYTNKKQEVANLAHNYNQLAEAKDRAESSGTDTVSLADAQAERVGRLKDRIINAVNGASLLNNKINDATSSSTQLADVWRRFKSIVSGAVSRVSNLLKTDFRKSVTDTATSHNKSFKKMLTTVLKYGFGIRSIFLLYRKLRTVISTGLGEMAKQFSDVEEDVYGLKNAWSGFKSSIVSAFQPIFSYVVPALVTLINYLTNAMNALANFFALLTGQGYYYKAKKGNESVADAIDKTTKSASEANEQLAEYDDLLVIDQDNNNADTSGSGSSSDSDAWNWEKVDVTANSLTEKLKDIWDVFKQAWDAKGQDVINAAKYALSSLKDLAIDIADTFYRVFTDGYGFDWNKVTQGL